MRRELGPRLAQGRTAEIYAWSDNRVVKLLREGFSSSALEGEALANQVAYDAGLPVPKFEGRVEVEGRPGILFERIDGISLADELSSQSWTEIRAAHLLAELHQRVHQVHVTRLPSVKERLARNIRALNALASDIRVAALDALQRLPDGDAVCHGDFHPGNILMSARGPVIVDWNDATRGDPLADVARTCLLGRIAVKLSGSRFPFGLELLLRSYLERYLEVGKFSREQIEAWEFPVTVARLAEGIPEERTILLATIEGFFAG